MKSLGVCDLCQNAFDNEQEAIACADQHKADLAWIREIFRQHVVDVSEEDRAQIHAVWREEPDCVVPLKAMVALCNLVDAWYVGFEAYIRNSPAGPLDEAAGIEGGGE